MHHRVKTRGREWFNFDWLPFLHQLGIWEWWFLWKKPAPKKKTHNQSAWKEMVIAVFISTEINLQLLEFEESWRIQHPIPVQQIAALLHRSVRVPGWKEIRLKMLGKGWRKVPLQSKMNESIVSSSRKWSERAQISGTHGLIGQPPPQMWRQSTWISSGSRLSSVLPNVSLLKSKTSRKEDQQIMRLLFNLPPLVI